MRHRQKVNRLRRNNEHRDLMVRNLLTSLFLEGKIKTTDARAKVVAQEVDKMFSRLRKTGETHNQIRFLNSILFSEIAARRLMEEHYPKTAERSSGFTRLTRVGIRKGDAATLIQVELI